MKLNFVKLDPSGNTTAIILNSLPRNSYGEIASQIMKPESLSVEQVGFVEQKLNSKIPVKLQMMGGEFCGNAARAFATWIAKQKFPGVYENKSSKNKIVKIQISGYTGELTAMVKPLNLSTEVYDTKISMPIPKYIKEYYINKNYYTVVSFEGIVHIIVWNLLPSKEQFYLIKKDLRNIVADVDCFGVMFYNENQELLTPLVYVKKVNSLVWESSCGSGSAAVVAAIAYRNKKSVDSLILKQPKGNIKASAKWDEKVVEINISGSVSIISEGTVYLDI